MAKKEKIDEELFNKMRKKETVPLKAMDFIQDAYDIKNYILYNEEDRKQNFAPNEIENKVQGFVKKIEYIATMVNLNNVFEIAGYTKEVPIKYKQSIEWKFDTLDTKESNPNVVNKKDDK